MQVEHPRACVSDPFSFHSLFAILPSIFLSYLYAFTLPCFPCLSFYTCEPFRLCGLSRSVESYSSVRPTSLDTPNGPERLHYVQKRCALDPIRNGQFFRHNHAHICFHSTTRIFADVSIHRAGYSLDSRDLIQRSLL